MLVLRSLPYCVETLLPGAVRAVGGVMPGVGLVHQGRLGGVT